VLNTIAASATLGYAATHLQRAGSGAADGSADLPPDPDFPVAGDAIDNALPGQGPEDLSGPDDDDPLPE
jgi:hypothetical protein